MRLGLVVALPEEARAMTWVMPGARRERIEAREVLGSPPARARYRNSFEHEHEQEASRPESYPTTPSTHLITGQLGGHPAMVAWSGAGTGGAARAAESLLQRGAEALLAVGFAGALSPALQPGDLLLAVEVLEPGGGCWAADAVWLAALASAAARNRGCPNRGPSAIMAAAKSSSAPASAPVHQGKLVTAPRVVVTAAEKRRLGEATGALAVDMESAAVARCAAAAGVPVLVLRAITDGVDEGLPLDFTLCFDSDGQFHYTRLIRLLARRPVAVGGLIRLGHRSAQAGQALASFLASNLSVLPR